MNITGYVIDVFGSYNVRRVLISIYDGDDTAVIRNSLAIHQNSYNNPDMYRYYLNWTWIPNITASSPDNTNDDYHVIPLYVTAGDTRIVKTKGVPNFDMLPYAVFLMFEGQLREIDLQTGEVDSKIYLNITVYNTGLDEETVYLASASFNWDVEVENDAFILPAGQDTEIMVTVTIPDTAEEGDDDTIEIEATLDDDDPDWKDSIKFDVEAIGKIDFKFERKSNRSYTIEPGEAAEYWFEVTNLGSDTMEFIIENDETPDTGWVIEYDPGKSVVLNDGIMIQINVSIGFPGTPGPSTETVQDIMIRAWPKDHYEMNKFSETSTILKTYDILQSITSNPDPATGLGIQ
jgi:uncharacterized membrane protein